MKHISIIIPTHNRVKSLELLLNRLGQQTYPMHLLEVVVVADGCLDETGDLLRSFRAPYTLRYVEQDSKGPAAARNRGAARAAGDLLLFLDDDIEPAEGMVEAHVRAHYLPDRVVIGYLPYQSPKFTGFYIAQLKAWWENKFYSMRLNGYRYTYEDLLSGNFSLPARLFRDLGGFNETLRCHEDYELGIRLIKAGARFAFEQEACGKHRDEATDFHRSLWRKRQEGTADVQLGIIHPTLRRTLRLSSFTPPYNRAKANTLFLVYRAPAVGSVLAALMQKWLHVMEWLKFRYQWRKLASKLQSYWYMKGVADQLPTLKQLHAYLQQQPYPADADHELEVDLREGVKAAENLLDVEQPAGVHIWYGSQHIGHIPTKEGAEGLRGEHLRAELATTLAWSLSKAMALEKATNSGTGSNAGQVLQSTGGASERHLNKISYGNQSARV